MAIVAIPDDPYMLAGRGSGFYTTRVRMATGALPGCTGKNALSMAGLTVGDGVGKIQRETGVVMIKIRAQVKRRGISHK